MNNLEKLRELIIKRTKSGKFVGPIDLAMVLMSLPDSQSYFHASRTITIGSAPWDLKHDLDGQCEVTIRELLNIIIDSEAPSNQMTLNLDIVPN